MIPPIRVADADEAAALLDLWRRAESAPSVTDTAHDVGRVLAEPHARVFVSDDAGALAGSVIATFDGWRGNMYRMAVDPAYRRRGVALALAAAAEAWLREQGAKRVSALVVGDSLVAQSFWHAAGFEIYDGMLRYVKTV